MTVKLLAKDTVLMKTVCEAMPCLNATIVLILGKEVVMVDPTFGEIKITCTSIKDNAIVTLTTFEKYDKLEATMTATSTGLTMVTTSKDKGHSVTEELKKVVDFDGSYRLVKQKGYKEFPVICDQFPMDLFLDPLFKFSFKKVGNTIVESFFVKGETSEVHSTLGEEKVDPQFKDVATMTVEVAPGVFKTVSKNTATGQVQETTSTFDGHHVTMILKDLKTGATAESLWEKFTDFSGEFKIISIAGIEEFAPILGADVVEFKKAYLNPKTKFLQKEMGNTLIDTTVCGDMKEEHVYTYGEECTVKSPLIKNPMTTLLTKHGNQLIGVIKVGNVTIKTNTKLTKNFMTSIQKVEGTDIACTVIMMPV